ncbi:MAG: hypothetical protein DRJ64_00215 [Thermoprotei archaeon]|nr:MAG: hypothetical protein DRJ64_00215 [Thermoprotei archaeon]
MMFNFGFVHQGLSAGKQRTPVRIIKEASGKVICDTCAVAAWLRELGIETLVTNSAKTTHYAPSISGGLKFHFRL